MTYNAKYGTSNNNTPTNNVDFDNTFIYIEIIKFSFEFRMHHNRIKIKINNKIKGKRKWSKIWKSNIDFLDGSNCGFRSALKIGKSIGWRNSFTSNFSSFSSLIFYSFLSSSIFSCFSSFSNLSMAFCNSILIE